MVMPRAFAPMVPNCTSFDPKVIYLKAAPCVIIRVGVTHSVLEDYCDE